MSERNTARIVLIVLAVIGGLAILWVLGMWVMHSMMMGNGMMGSGMMGSGMMGSMTCAAYCFLPLVLLAGAVMALAIVLLRRNRSIKPE
jgi:hypothetical protein